jgi:hypothetical protein
MNYENLSTASDILEAFRICKNPGAEIELFESLATRAEPPIEALLEIVEKVKLEAALILAIEAFGLISNAEIKAELKQNNELLGILSDRAKTGTSNTIRWAAAVTIDKIGFSFLNISQHFTEEPCHIADKILESKRKILIDLDDATKGEQIIDKGEYKESVYFWTYGPTYMLRSISPKYQGNNYAAIVMGVVKKQDLYGLKETNKLLQKAEIRDYPDRLTKATYENEPFQRFNQRLSSKFLKSDDADLFKLGIVSQGHALQSNENATRLRAASLLLAIDEKSLVGLDFVPKLLVVSRAIINCDFDPCLDFSYPETTCEDLAKIVGNLKLAREIVSRDRVSEYFTNCFNKLAADLAILSPETSRKDMLSELEQLELAEQIKQGQLAKSEQKRLEEKENETWHGKNKLELTKDKIHGLKSTIATSLPQIAQLDSSLYLRIKEISTQSAPEDDDSLNDYRQSIVDDIKSNCQDYHVKRQSELTLLEDINRDLQSKVSKLKEKEATILIGYAFLVAGISCTLISNIWSIFAAVILIGIFIFIAKLAIDRTGIIKNITKSIVDNTAKAEKIKADIKIIDGLIASVNKNK